MNTNMETIEQSHKNSNIQRATVFATPDILQCWIQTRLKHQSLLICQNVLHFSAFGSAEQLYLVPISLLSLIPAPPSLFALYFDICSSSSSHSKPNSLGLSVDRVQTVVAAVLG